MFPEKNITVTFAMDIVKQSTFAEAYMNIYHVL